METKNEFDKEEPGAETAENELPHYPLQSIALRMNALARLIISANEAMFDSEEREGLGLILKNLAEEVGTIHKRLEIKLVGLKQSSHSSK